MRTGAGAMASSLALWTCAVGPAQESVRPQARSSPGDVRKASSSLMSNINTLFTGSAAWACRRPSGWPEIESPMDRYGVRQVHGIRMRPAP